MARKSSSLAKPIEQCPRQHKRHQPAKHIADPEVAARTVKVALRVAIRLERVDERRDQRRAEQVEDEARVRLQA